MMKSQKLADQIMSNLNAKNMRSPPIGSNSMSPFDFKFTPSHTAEFGIYTKLVREGGSIVYFCQACNSKNQQKVSFKNHCDSSGHKLKVKHAEKNRKEGRDPFQGNSVDNSQKYDLTSNRHDKNRSAVAGPSFKLQYARKCSVNTNYQEPVNWQPRGHVSYMETSNFCGISPLQSQKDKQQCTQISTELCPAEHKREESFKETGNIDLSDRSKPKISPEQHSQDTKPTIRLNKRKRAVPTQVRNIPELEHNWGSDEAKEKDEETDISIAGQINEFAENSCLEQDTYSPTVEQPMSFITNNDGKRRLLTTKQEMAVNNQKNTLGVDCSISTPHRRNPSPTSNSIRRSLDTTDEPAPNVSLSQIHIDTIDTPDHNSSTGTLKRHVHAQNTMETTGRNANISPVPNKNVFQTNELSVCVSSTSSKKILNIPQGHSPPGDWPYTSKYMGFSLRDILTNEKCSQKFKCSMCDFSCQNEALYNTHFEAEHVINLGRNDQDSMSFDGKGETWKMIKIKEQLTGKHQVFRSEMK